MLRRLRIAASVFFVVLTMALSVLWAMSYTWVVGVNHTGANNAASLFSMNGSVRLNGTRFPPGFMFDSDRPIPAWTVGFGPSDKEINPRGRWQAQRRGNAFRSSVPHWFLILVSAILATLMGIPFAQYRPPIRFSLRTMLITTTLLAVVLGLVCYVVRG